MYAIQTHSIKSLRNWNQCKQYFKEKPAPRATVNWSKNERPLRDVSAPHLKVIHNTDDSYSLKLFDSVLVRYYAPDEKKGWSVDLYVPYYWVTRSTWNFLDNAGWFHNKALLASRRLERVCLGLYPSEEQDGWSAHLVFNKDGKLLIDASWHLQAYSVLTGNDGAVFRARAARMLQNTALLLWIGQDSITPVYDAKFKPPFKAYGSAPSAQLHPSTLPQLCDLVNGHREALDEAAYAGLLNWFWRTHDVHYTQYGTKAQFSEAEILAKLVRLVQEDEKHTFETLKRPRLMFTKSKQSRSSQYFTTRAEAERAKQKVLDAGV